MTNTAKIQNLINSGKRAHHIAYRVISLLRLKTHFAKVKYSDYIRLEIENGKISFVQDMLDNEEADFFTETANELLEEKGLLS